MNILSYAYNAAGAKVQKKVTQDSYTITTDYLDGFQYENEQLMFFGHAEGYVSLAQIPELMEVKKLSYVYNYVDHLGNIRLSYTEDPKHPNELIILEENNYYPFGLKHQDYNKELKKVDFWEYAGLPQQEIIDHAEKFICIVPVVKGEYKYKYNSKEWQDELNLNLYDYGARNYDAALGRWMNVDPLAEKASNWTPYRYGFNNPIRYTDPTGMWEDDLIFNEKGDFVRIDKNDQPDKLVIENSQTGARQNYWFADPKEDTQQIRDGIINKVVFVGKSQIEGMLSKQGAFNPDNKDSWTHFYKESKGGQDFDYSYSVIPTEFASQGASSNPLNTPSPMLFIPEGDYMAHNHMNFGNYLWAASGYTLGFNYSTLQMAAHANSLLNSGSNGYPAQLDSKDDQSSIIKGAYYAQKNGFRQILQKAVEAQKSQNKR
ncbi:MAG: RHS repeat-associated core domain-containing protein [Flavobacteriaceae bacterium]|nr:RHS repeat-associated core domain-containing protein [Flavobacteriaceae bacterium]